MTTRQGRRDHRAGAPVSDNQDLVKTCVEKLMREFYAAIQAALANKTQGQINATITVYNGGVSEFIIGDMRKFKPESIEKTE